MNHAVAGRFPPPPACRPRWRRLGIVVLGWLCLWPAAGGAGEPGTGCREQVLQALGWRIHDDGPPVPRIAGGQPCRHGSLAQARAAGDLQLWLPRGLDAVARQRVLAEALDDPASRCAWSIALGQATRRAAARLQGNPGYRFTAVQLGWIGFGLAGARAQGWAPTRSFGRGYRPAGTNTGAIEAFYSGHVRSECGVGRQVAQLAGLRELFGDAGFDRDFAPGELTIGTFATLHDSDSILLGRHAGPLVADGKGRRAAQAGRQAFMGLPGFIEHMRPRRYLDDLNNQAENFVVTDVTADAADALAAHDGLAHYDALNDQLWRLSQQLPRLARHQYQRLLDGRDARLLARFTPAQRERLARMQALLDDPFYRGFMVYVHPQGIRPIGFHVVRLLDLNPRTPYAIELTLHNLPTTIYRRWLEGRLRDCAATATPATARTAGG